MNIETLKLPVRELTLGMHVVKLDRPWLETPFTLQGFRIKSATELKQLADHCSFVYVDIEHGITPPSGRGERVTLNEDGEVVEIAHTVSALAPRGRDSQREGGRGANAAALPAPAVQYTTDTTFVEELPAARAALDQLKFAVKHFMQALRNNQYDGLDAIKDAAGALEDSMLRNPDPAMLIRALGSDEPFSFRHCVNSAILAINLGRALGLRRQTIHELSMGVLLADVGKIRLPKELLRTTRRLDKRETEIIKLHVKFGVAIATDLGGLTPGTLEIIAGHHERFDGSGYPRGLSGGEIPLLARVAGLADSFDAITSERTYSEAIAIHEAVQELYAATVDVFQRDLVELLIQVLGTHPIGSLVELSDGSVALVVALNRQRRLLPWVIALTDGAKHPLAPHRLVNLAGAGAVVVTVKDVLHPGTYGIDQPTVGVLDA